MQGLQQTSVCPIDGRETTNGLTAIPACDDHWDNPERAISTLRECAEALAELDGMGIPMAANGVPQRVWDRIHRAAGVYRVMMAQTETIAADVAAEYAPVFEAAEQIKTRLPCRVNASCIMGDGHSGHCIDFRGQTL